MPKIINHTLNINRLHHTQQASTINKKAFKQSFLKRLQWTKQATIIMASMLLCMACSQSTPENKSATNETSAQDTTDSKYLPSYRVVSNTSYPPFEYLDKQGNIIGFDIDLLNAIAKEEEFKVTFDSRPWTALFSELENNDADIIASSVWITEERKQNYGVSTPYYSSPMSLLTKQEHNIEKNPIKYTNIQNQVVAVAIGGENSAFFDDFLKPNNNEKLTSGSSFLALQNLMSDKASYVSDSEVRLDYNIKMYKDQLRDGESFKIIKSQEFPVWEWGFIVKKDNQNLLDKINSGFEKVKQNGTYDKLYQKWFNKPAPLPQT